MMGAIARFLEYLRLERNRSQKTVEAYGRDLEAFRLFLQSGGNSGPRPEERVPSEEGGSETAEIDWGGVEVGEIRGWLSGMAAAGNGPATLRRKTQSLRSFFGWLVKSGESRSNPASLVRLAKLSKPLPEFVGEEKMEDVLSSRMGGDPLLVVRNKLILELLYSCGLRQAELAAIRDEDISISRKELRVHGKGSKTRVIPLPDMLLDKIEYWQRLRDGCGYGGRGNVVSGASGEGIEGTGVSGGGWLIPGRGDKPLSRTRLYRIVEEAMAGSGAHKRSPHVLRHSFATAMLNGGADIMTVKEFLGHSSLSSTQIYTHLNFRQLQKDYRTAHPRGEEDLDNQTKKIGEENQI